jgi:hypothetical protein
MGVRSHAHAAERLAERGVTRQEVEATIDGCHRPDARVGGVASNLLPGRARLGGDKRGYSWELLVKRRW